MEPNLAAVALNCHTLPSAVRREESNETKYRNVRVELCRSSTTPTQRQKGLNVRERPKTQTTL